MYMNVSLACLFSLSFLFTFIHTLCLAVDSLPLVLKLLCVIQANDPPSPSSCSKMDGVHFKLLYHGEVSRCYSQVILSLAVLPTALLY